MRVYLLKLQSKTTLKSLTPKIFPKSQTNAFNMIRLKARYQKFSLQCLSPLFLSPYPDYPRLFP